MYKVILVKIGCEGGFYGPDCRQRCGKCKHGSVCDNHNGTCNDGCQTWWTGTKCEVYIGILLITDFCVNESTHKFKNKQKAVSI